MLQWLVQREPPRSAATSEKTKHRPPENHSIGMHFGLVVVSASRSRPYPPGPQGAAPRGRPCGLPLGETRSWRRGAVFDRRRGRWARVAAMLTWSAPWDRHPDGPRPAPCGARVLGRGPGRGPCGRGAHIFWLDAGHGSHLRRMLWSKPARSWHAHQIHGASLDRARTCTGVTLPLPLSPIHQRVKRCGGSMSRFFISHSSADNFEAIGFHDLLIGEGWAPEDVFIDLHDLNPGERFSSFFEFILR